MIVVTVTAEDDAEADAPDGPVRPDLDTIAALIAVWDHRCATPHDCPEYGAPHRGAKTRFFRRLGRSPQSFWNLAAIGKRIGPAFIVQIADALHVPWKALTLPGDGTGTEDPQPQAEAA